MSGLTGDDHWEARGPGACSLLVGCLPFFAIHVFLEHQASAVRFVFPVEHGVPASGLQLRRFIRTGEISLRKWRSCTFQHSVVTLGRQFDQFQPSCDVTTYTVVSSAVASRCIDSRASGGKLKPLMRSQTRILEDENATESGFVDAPIHETESVDASSFAPRTNLRWHQHPRAWSAFKK